MEFPKIGEVKERLARAALVGEGDTVEVSRADLSYMQLYSISKYELVIPKLVEQLERFEFECDPSRTSGSCEEEFENSVRLRKAHGLYNENTDS